jgi:hypothetical protein
MLGDEGMSRYQKIGLAVLIAGVAGGSVFTNMTYQANYYFLADLNLDVTALRAVNELQLSHFAAYIAGKRIFQLILFLFIFRLFIAEAVIALLGFLGSFIFSVFFTFQILKSGTQGVIALLLAMFPQWIFYGAALCFFLDGETKKGKKKAFRPYVFFIILFVLGIITEIFLNPSILRW